jgi:hypothetical protein
VSETDAYLPLACTSDDDACRSIDQSRPCSAFGPLESNLIIVCTQREMLLLSLTDSISISSSCLVGTKSPCECSRRGRHPQVGRRLHLTPSAFVHGMGSFRCREWCRSSSCLRLSMLRCDPLQQISPSPASINKPKKKYLYHSKCVAPLRHWLDQTGSGPKLSPKHAPSDLFSAGKCSWRTGSWYRLWRRQASFTVLRFVI